MMVAHAVSENSFIARESPADAGAVNSRFAEVMELGAAYLAGRPVQRACGGSVFASAVLIRIALVSFVVLATR